MAANFNNLAETLIAGYGQYVNPLEIYTPGHKTYSVGSGDISGAIQNLEFLSTISGKDIANDRGKEEINKNISDTILTEMESILVEKGYSSISATSIKSVSKINQSDLNLFKLKNDESAILIKNTQNWSNISVKTDDINLSDIQIELPKNTKIGSRIIGFN